MQDSQELPPHDDVRLKQLMSEEFHSQSSLMAIHALHSVHDEQEFDVQKKL